MVVTPLNPFNCLVLARKSKLSGQKVKDRKAARTDFNSLFSWKIGHVFSLPNLAQICDFTSNFTNWPIDFFAKIRLTAHDSTTLTRPSIGHFMYTYGPSTLVMWSDKMLSSLLWEHPATYTVLQLANSACLQRVSHSVYIIQNYVRSINLSNSSFFAVQCCKK